MKFKFKFKTYILLETFYLTINPNLVEMVSFTAYLKVSATVTITSLESKLNFLHNNR